MAAAVLLKSTSLSKSTKVQGSFTVVVLRWVCNVALWLLCVVVVVVMPPGFFYYRFVSDETNIDWGYAFKVHALEASERPYVFVWLSWCGSFVTVR